MMPAGVVHHRLHTELAQQPMRTPAAGLHPDLIEAQDVRIGMAMRHFAHFVERVHQPLELLRQLGVDGRHAASGQRALQGVGQRPVGIAAHGDVIVDVDELARETAREESGDEQRYVAETLQAALPRRLARGVERIGEHVRQRPDAQAVRGLLVERLGAGKHGEQVDHIGLGLFVDAHPLVFARRVKRVAKEFAQ
jgi:hypothetical protein